MADTVPPQQQQVDGTSEDARNESKQADKEVLGEACF
jgi:hypothetical protein